MRPTRDSRRRLQFSPIAATPEGVLASAIRLLVVAFPEQMLARDLQKVRALAGSLPGRQWHAFSRIIFRSYK